MPYQQQHYITSIYFYSCIPSANVVQWETEYRAYGYDFQKYAKEGFLFTPDGYPHNL